MQQAPQMPHDLAEPLFKPFRQHSLALTIHQPQGQARKHQPLDALKTPANHIESKAGGDNGTGEQRGHWHRWEQRDEPQENQGKP